MPRLLLTISGRVQGVGYRRAAQREAIRLGLKGWVRNLFDGRVSCLAEGSHEGLEAFRRWSEKGPLFSQPDEVETQWLDATGEFEEFLILR
ncbi:MAG TPA: acylphosphatase [Cyanobacteria bacterium UBA8530]|nr:acylphosphatase [Cyanobacteria bacterium UBA8530]